MKALPIGGREVAPVRGVGGLVTVDFRKLPALVPLFLCKILILHFGRRSYPINEDLIAVTSINCILSYLVRLYISFPTETLR